MRKLTFFTCLLLLSTLLLLPGGAVNFESPIRDAAGLIADPEALILNTTCDCSSNGIRYFLVTGTDKEALYDSEVAARCGISVDEDAVILMIRYTGGTYHYNMHTLGETYNAFSRADIDAILDDPVVYNNLKTGNIEVGAARWLTLSEAKVNPYMEEEAARSEKWEENRIPRGIIISAVAFLLAGGGAVLGVFLYYRKKIHGEIYPLDRYARLDLTHHSDRFIGSYITRVRVNTNSGGSRGGGGRRGGRGGR